MAGNTAGNGKKQTLLGSVLAVAVLIIVGAARLLAPGSGALETGDVREVSSADVEGSAFESPEASEPGTEVTVESILEGAQSVGWAEGAPEELYSFRNERLLNQHYEKHGIEMGVGTVEEYVAAANAVINHPDALHKLEAEDNDDVYFLEATNEFVVVSTDGYIRTYFIASGGIDYYNRQ